MTVSRTTPSAGPKPAREESPPPIRMSAREMLRLLDGDEDLIVTPA